MRDGLRKGTETVKRNKMPLFPMVCKGCNKIFYVKHSDLKKRKYCSQKCASAHNDGRGLQMALEKKIEANKRQHEEMSADIVKWTIENKEIVVTCPMNKIESTLFDLKTEIGNKYGVKDFRSIMSCFGITSRKEFVHKLREIVNEENVRRTGLN